MSLLDEVPSLSVLLPCPLLLSRLISGDRITHSVSKANSPFLLVARPPSSVRPRHVSPHNARARIENPMVVKYLRRAAAAG
jgi:hypothetical protein